VSWAAAALGVEQPRFEIGQRRRPDIRIAGPVRGPPTALLDGRMLHKGNMRLILARCSDGCSLLMARPARRSPA